MNYKHKTPINYIKQSSLCSFCIFLFAQICVGASQETIDINYRQSPFLSNGKGSFLLPPTTEEINSDVMERKNALKPTDVLNSTSSLRFFGQEEGGAPPSLFLRGSQNDHILQIWNDFPLNDPSSPKYSANPQSASREFTHNLMVLKGPQTLLYGSSALAGVLIWERDKDNPGRLGLGVGSMNNSTALIEKTYFSIDSQFIIGGRQFSAEGLSDLSEKNGKSSEIDRKTQQSFTSAWSKTLNEDAKMQIWYTHFSSFNDDDSPPYDDQNAFTGLSENDYKISYESQIKDSLKQETRLILIQNQREHRDDFDSQNQSYYLDSAKSETLLLQTHWQYQLSKNSKLLFGLDLPSEKINLQSTSSYSTETWSKSQDTKEVYLIATQNISQHELSLGSRAQCNKLDNCENVYQTMYQFLGLNFRPYLSLGTGIKKPSLYQLYSSYGEKNLKSEKSLSYELGLFSYFSDKPDAKTLNPIMDAPVQAVNAWQISLFSTDFTDLIDYDFSKNKYQNISEVQNRGMENILIFSVLEQGSLRISHTYLEAFDVQNHERLLRRPYHQISSEFKININQNTWALSEYLYSGQTDDISNGKKISLKEYGIWNLGLGKKIPANANYPQQLWSLRCNNFFDLDYESVSKYSSPRQNFWLSYTLEL